MLSLGAQQNSCRLKEIQTLIKHSGCDMMVLPPISSYADLHSFVTELQLTMLVSLELNLIFVQLLIDI